MSTNRVLYLDRLQAERLAQQIADFLENRMFAKNPHIGLIGPGTRGAEADSIDLLSEIIEEQTEQWLSPYVSGFRVNLQKISDKKQRKIKVCYSFSIRVSPPSLTGSPPIQVNENDQFHCLDVCLVIMNECLIDTSLVVYDGLRQNILYSRNASLKMESGQARLVVPDQEYRDARNALTTAIAVGYDPNKFGSRFTHSFALEVSMRMVSSERLQLAVRLLGGEGSFLDERNRIIQVDDENERFRRQGLVDAENEPWSISQLYELHSSIRLEGYDFLIRVTEHGIAGLRPINCAYDLEALNQGELRFRDYALVPERGRAIRQSDMTVEGFFRQVVSRYSNNLNLTGERAEKLIAAGSEALNHLIDHSDHLYTFQEDCTFKVLDSIVENQAPLSAVPMAVQTAGGKTLGFLIPISIYAFSLKFCSQPSHGVKAFLFYPTKALINDQSDTIIRLLWNLNKSLQRLGIEGRQITFGVLHGDILSKNEISHRLKRTGQAQFTESLRFKCPNCGSQLEVTYTLVGENGILETVKCSGTENASCSLSVNNEEITFLNSMVKVIRDSIYANPPDIVVATPDMINYRLFFDPSSQSIFGRSIKRCPVCSYTTAYLSQRGSCPHCGAMLEGPFHFAPPRIFVFDEAHQLRGSFGSQVSHVMSRLEQAVKVLSGISDFRPVYVFSSATLSRAQTFIRDFFGQSVPTKELVRADYLPEAELIQRVHLFMVPKGYSPQATLVQTIKATFQNFPYKDRYPNVLVFVNSLAEANEIIHLLRHHRGPLHQGYENLPPPIIDGHSTDYGNEQRVEVEDGFSRGSINVLVATSTLQVGLDFNRIDVLIIYGAPFYLSDYVQRMGRAGRRHAAVILSILPNKPVDFFFFSNYPLVTNFDIRDRALDAEAVRISRDNQIIRRRSAVRAFMDYLCTHPDAPRYYSDKYKNTDLLLRAIFAGEKAGNQEEILEAVATEADLNPNLFTYIERALRSPLEDTEKRSILRTIDDLIQLMATHGITCLSGALNQRIGFLDKIYAGDLRQSDYTVRIEYPDLLQLSRSHNPNDPEYARQRSLAIAIGDYALGQITSYRSYYFIVDHVESDPTMSTRIRNSLFRREASSRREDL
jgi:ssDNA-binding Zn-finger/Zn-ribbon topoisomerase 1